jgi:hypothetical protein
VLSRLKVRAYNPDDAVLHGGRMANETKDWVVTTSGDRPLAEVAKDLKKSGFRVGEVLDELNMITGEAGHDAAAKARKVKGVTDVSANAGADVGPPGSSETW